MATNWVDEVLSGATSTGSKTVSLATGNVLSVANSSSESIFTVTSDTTNGGFTSILGIEAQEAVLFLAADNADDAADVWSLEADTSGNFKLGVRSSGTGSPTRGNTITNVLTLTGSNVKINEDSVCLQGTGLGARNTVFGEDAGDALEAGGSYSRDNSFFGDDAGTAVTTGDFNTAIGASALTAVTTASYNTAVGYYASRLITGGNNTSMGYKALSVGTSAANNTAIGYESLNYCTGDSNVAIGVASGKQISSADYSIALGDNACGGLGANPLTGDNNICVGYIAGKLLEGAATNNTIVGSSAGIALTTGNSNVLIGKSAGAALTDDSQHIAIGVEALEACTIGGTNSCIAIGYKALEADTIGINNIAIGYEVLKANVDGHYNTVIGYQAMTAFEADSGKTLNAHNVAMGHRAGYTMTTGTQNVLIGSTSGHDLTTGDDNTFLGINSGYNILTGSDNVAVGAYALYAGDGSETGNTAVGYSALYSTNTDGTNANTAIGYKSGYSVSTGTYNTSLGYTAGQYVSTGAYNTSVGGGAGGGNDTVLTGDYNTSVGYRAGYDLQGAAYQNTLLGAQAADSLQTGHSNTVLGYAAMNTANNNETGNVAIGNAALSEMDGDEGDTRNTAVGTYAGYYISTGIQNTLMGYAAGFGLDGTPLLGDGNTALGYHAGYLMQGAAAYNTFVGRQVGDNITTGTNNTMLGHHISASAVDVTYEIVIGSGVDASNDFDGGGTDTIRVGRAAEYMTMDITGSTAGAWAHGSDVRIKKDILDNELGLDFINDLRTVNYKKKAPSEYPKEFKGYDANETERKNPDRVHYGFIAQEVKEAMDKAGHSNFPMWSEDEDSMQELAEAALIAPLVKAIQELSEKISKLENKE